MRDPLLLTLKFALAVFLIPVILGTTTALQSGINALPADVHDILVTGMISYVLLRFFVYDFSPVYAFGQGMVVSIFRFLKPVVHAAPYILPVYTFLALALCGIFTMTGMGTTGRDVCLFFASFTFTMHIILTAQTLYSKDSVGGKPDYFFGMTLVYIVDVFLIALIMGLAVGRFSFTDFFNILVGTTQDIYLAVFHQLF